MNEHERSNRIEAIIGYSKLQRFLALERNLFAYAEVQRMGSLLRRHGVPLTDAQREGLLQISIEAKARSRAMPPPDAERHSIEYLEHRMIQIDEYERRVLELAPSVLSREQLEPLFEQYQHMSYERAYALQIQKRRRADPANEDNPLWYPVWADWK